ncbi:MAG: hypothetical protein H7288_17890 [Kineosporiaceae bacterium]|nr:hypothetical protein [Aeromicrobium sp.]
MKTIRKLVATASAVALVIVASPAMAAAPYTVTAGSQTAGTVPIYGTTDAIYFYTDFIGFSCDSGSFTGTANLGTNPTGLGVATIDDTEWNDCLGPLSMPLAFDQIGSWDLNAVGDTVGGVTGTTITDIAMRVASVTAGQCEYTVTGQVGGSFNENTQQLTIDDLSPDNNLVISDVLGCFGQVLAGDAAYLAMTYDITNNSDGELAIASS